MQHLDTEKEKKNMVPRLVRFCDLSMESRITPLSPGFLVSLSSFNIHKIQCFKNRTDGSAD